jgi:uncharacterized membrane protein
MEENNSLSQPERPTLAGRISRALRQYFLSGLATLFPIALTAYIITLLFRAADGFLGRYLGFTIPGLGIVVTVLLITLVGFFSVHVFGRILFRALEFWLNRLPFIKKIYPAVKQFTNLIFETDPQKGAFRSVVLVEYPRKGSYALAFVTNEQRTAVTGEERTLLFLMVSQPPSPFTGPIIIVPKEDVIPLAMTIEEAIKFVVSDGVVAPALRLGRLNGQGVYPNG